MINLLALALVAFALALVLLGLVQYYRTRQRPALVWVGIGAAALLVFFFLASRFALQLLGALPFALDLNQFAVTALLPLGVGLVAVAAAYGIFRLAQKRFPLAIGLMLGGSLVLLLALYGITRWQAQTAAAQPTALEHPSLVNLILPKGFHANIFASDLQEPNALAFDDAGNLYYTELVDGNVVRLSDANGTGVANDKKVFASGFKNPRGLVWHDGKLYVASRGQINTLRDTNGDGVADENNVILDHLFSLDIQHSNNGITFGPDGKLYIAIGGPRVGQLDLRGKTYWYEGQTRDDWLFGGVLQVDADGKNPKLYARGLRNPYSLAFGADGKLFATDNGDETIPVPDGDELNLIEPGKDYGYPYYFGIPPPWTDTQTPIIRFAPHTAPTGVVVYDANQFPHDYRGNVLTTLYWRGREASSYRVVARVFPVEQEGKTVWKIRNLIEGLDRPVALTVGPDGALYVADMRGGKAAADFPGAIYRITYMGDNP